jgi:hypothetical protein
MIASRRRLGHKQKSKFWPFHDQQAVRSATTLTRARSPSASAGNSILIGDAFAVVATLTK